MSDLDSCMPEFRDQMSNIEATLPELLERLGASRVLEDDFGKYGSTALNSANNDFSDDLGGGSGGDVVVDNAGTQGDLGGGSSGNTGGNDVADSEEARDVRRIYTIEQAVDALGSKGRNTFSIKYR